MTQRDFRDTVDNANKATKTEKPKFRPIFTATVIPASIEHGTDKNNQPYITMKGATVNGGKRPPHTATVMVFGSAMRSVENKLTTGEPLELALQRDFHTLRVIGEAWSQAERAENRAKRRSL